MHATNRSRCWLPVCGALLLAALADVPRLAAQGPEPGARASYQSYPCRHQDASKVLSRLRAALEPSADQFDFVLDGPNNRILVAAEPELQDAVAQLLEVFDRPAAPPPSEPAVVRAYPVPPNVQPRVIDGLRRRFDGEPSLRVIDDPDSEQIVVIAPPSLQQQVAAWLGGGPPPQPAWQEPSRPPAADGAGQRELPLPSFGMDQLGERLARIFGRRVRQVEQRGGRQWELDLRHGAPAMLRWHPASDRLTLVAPPEVAEQVVRLVSLLEPPPYHQATPAVRIVATRRANVQASGPRPGPHGIDAAAQQTPPGESQRLVAQLQPADPVELELPAVDPDETVLEEELRRRLRELGEGIEIEVLPDLDVIILRGRERDIEELARIIQELEMLAQEILPEIRIHPLRHARGESVQQLFNDVEADLNRARQGRVTVTALGKPNALLVIGWGQAVEAALELIRKLDRPVDPETQLRVFPLAHAHAAQISQAVEQFFDGRAALGPNVTVIAETRVNALIVHAAPRDVREIELLVAQLDVPGARAVNQVLMFPIRHALVTDLAQTLEDTLQAATGGTATQRTAVLELLELDGDDRRVLRSGVLTDVQLTPNARNNSLIVSGPAEGMDLVASLIEQLDAPGAVSQIKIFRIENGNAVNLVELLQALLPAAAGGAALPTAPGEAVLTPLRFSVDDRTNSIVATGSEGDLRVIEALLLRLDEQDLRERQNEVYHLKNAPAIDVANAINRFLTDERRIQVAVPGVTSPFQQIEQEVVVVPEPVSNKLILSATPRYFEEVHELIQKLDEAPPQVMIQVLIAEVSLNETDEWGVELGLQDSVLFDRSLLGNLITTVSTVQESTPAGVVTSTQEIIQSATNTPGFNFNSEQLGNSASDRALRRSGRVGSQGLSNFAVGRINSELGFGGLVLSASSDSVSMLIRALQDARRVEILSRPQIRTLDNQPAFIQVGQRVPRIIGSTIGPAGQSNAVTLEAVGLILGVTPRISPDGTVVMEIDAEKSSLGPEAEGVPVAISAEGTIVRSPNIDATIAQATVSAASGETIVLGGLITRDRLEVERKVPYLSDIPILGNLFRYQSIGSRRFELLVILTPHIIRTSADDQRLRELEFARMSWCAADVYDIHGDVHMRLGQDPALLDGDTEVIFPFDNPRGTADEPDWRATTPELFYPDQDAFPPADGPLLD